MLVVSIVERYAFSLTSIRLRETLRNQSIRDPLNLYNRRHMQGSLIREERRAKRHGTSWDYHHRYLLYKY
jgi:hypothetical protein